MGAPFVRVHTVLFLSSYMSGKDCQLLFWLAAGGCIHSRLGTRNIPSSGNRRQWPQPLIKPRSHVLHVYCDLSPFKKYHCTISGLVK